MSLTKAFINKLRFFGHEDLQIKPWMVTDDRSLPINDIWSQLGALGIHLDRKALSAYANECDTPEELADLIIDDPAMHDQAYLLLFELWRRLFPERASLSIFCDEFDHQIHQYYKGELESDEPIQDSLANLSEILEDAKMKPADAMASISDYFAYDLATFIYDYIVDLIEQENTLYAQELYDEFAPYFLKNLSFEFLHAKLSEEGNEEIKVLLAKKLPADLLFDIIEYLVSYGEHDLFQTAIKQLLPQITTEEEFHDLAELSAEYYRRLDKDEKEQAILHLLERRKKTTASLAPDLLKLKDLVLK
jgi:hypothetical protein